MSAPRAILHVDMDAFYASVEQRDNPSLKGQPVLVGGRSQRGVVAAASYEARGFGIHSAMPVREALARCPHAVCIKPRLDHYKSVSNQVFEIFRSITPEVEGLSLDEAFLDVSQSLELFGEPVAIGRLIKTRILEATRLNASVGVATNKLVAKIASDLDKPDGLTIVVSGTEAATLAPLPVKVLPGVGRVKQQQLKRAGIETIADLQRATDAQLSRLFGRYAARMRERAHGIDTRPVISARDEKSISAETTFDQDLHERDDLHRILRGLADRTATRLRNKQRLAGVIQLKVRQSDFATFTRQSRLQPASNSTDLLYREAVQLLDDWLVEHPGKRVRLLGVGGSRLVADRQLDLFTEQPKLDSSRVDRTVDAVRERFSELGSNALQSARTLSRDD